MIAPLLFAAQNFQLALGKCLEWTDISNIYSDARFRQVRLNQRFSLLNAHQNILHRFLQYQYLGPTQRNSNLIWDGDYTQLILKDPQVILIYNLGLKSSAQLLQYLAAINVVLGPASFLSHKRLLERQNLSTHLKTYCNRINILTRSSR